MAVASLFAQCTGRGINTFGLMTEFYSACQGGSQETIGVDGPTITGFDVPTKITESTSKLIEWLAKQEDEHNTVNMAGYSRGGVIVIGIANELKRIETCLKEGRELLDYPGIEEHKAVLIQRLNRLELNLLTMDPVAGPGAKSKLSAKVIPEKVSHYVTLLPIDEMRRDFKPQDISRQIIASNQTKVVQLPFYGGHSDINFSYALNRTSGATLTWHLIHQFLTEHGTEIIGNPSIPGLSYLEGLDPDLIRRETQRTDLQEPDQDYFRHLLDLFDKQHEERQPYLDNGQGSNVFRENQSFFDSFPVPKKERRVKKYLKYYVEDSHFFVNQLERALFKISYPRIFNFLFEQNKVDARFVSASTLDEVLEDLRAINNTHLRMRIEAELERKGNRPGGSYHLETLTSLEPFFFKKHEHVVEAAFSPRLNLSKLESQIYSLCFQYERQKSDFMPLNEKNGFECSRSLREEVHQIIHYQDLSDEDACQMILTRLEEQYLQLAKASTRNQFDLVLKELLVQHNCYYQVTNASPYWVDFINLLFTLIREAIIFAGTLGYLGGFIVSTLGSFIEGIGQRAIYMFTEQNPSPVITPIVTVIGYCLQYSGYVLKHHLGLRPVVNFVSSCIEQLKEGLITCLGTVQVERVRSVVEPPNEVISSESLDRSVSLSC